MENSNHQEYVTSLEKIREAHERIRENIHMTPKTGSFKARGALNAILKNRYDSVTTHSSGNHGQALAWAAKKIGIPATIVMPNNSPNCKHNAVLEYQGQIRFVEPTQAAREEGARQVVLETGAAFVHPYDNPDVVAGQGTIAIEFLSQVENLDILVIPLGGGGLCSGITIAAKALKPGIKIIGAEPGKQSIHLALLISDTCQAEADDIFRSRLSGERQANLKTPVTLADGLKADVGELTWPVVRDLVDDVITVSEEAIVASMRLIWERMKVTIEPSAAVGLAAVLSETFQRKWRGTSEEKAYAQHIGIILCGGNVDFEKLGGIFGENVR